MAGPGLWKTRAIDEIGPCDLLVIFPCNLPFPRGLGKNGQMRLAARSCPSAWPTAWMPLTRSQRISNETQTDRLPTMGMGIPGVACCATASRILAATGPPATRRRRMPQAVARPAHHPDRHIDGYGRGACGPGVGSAAGHACHPSGQTSRARQCAARLCSGAGPRCVAASHSRGRRGPDRCRRALHHDGPGRSPLRTALLGRTRRSARGSPDPGASPVGCGGPGGQRGRRQPCRDAGHSGEGRGAGRGPRGHRGAGVADPGGSHSAGADGKGSVTRFT